MPRSLVLGNGQMLATFDEYLQMRDLYYPYVGMEDQTTYGHFHRVGFWSEGHFSWTNDGTWEITISYAEDTLVGYCTAVNRKLEISVLFEDFVYTTSNILFRKLTVHNLSEREREIKVFFSQDLHLYGDKMQDTAQYEPDFNGVLHYRKNRYFFVGGVWEKGPSMHEFSVGKSEYMGKEGTWRDAEDGRLEGNTVEQGSVDSTVGFANQFGAKESKTLFFWLIAGKKYEDVHRGLDRILELSPQVILDHTREFWLQWVRKEQFAFEGVSDEIKRFFRRSLLIIRTQIDQNGAIIAANDSDIMRFNKDTYTYMWPRDGALVSMALSEAGYESMAQNFLTFCSKIITRDGYVLHKYNPDGSLGSSWHPKWKDGERQLPIQEDESALILVAIQKYYECFHNIEVIQKMFDNTVLKIARWLIKYTDKKTGLPLPSYDPWEEHRGVFTYTASCTYAGLKAAAYLAVETGHLADAKTFSTAAEKLKKALLKYLYSEKNERFLKGVIVKNGEIVEEDATIDASISFLWKMGVLPVTDERVQKTMQAIENTLTVSTKIGGLARYSHDAYHFDFDHVDRHQVPGNPWIITTLWQAEYQILRAESRNDLVKPLKTLEWVVASANSAGILAEQLHPLDGRPLSVAPLTWSHATFISTVILLEKRWRELGTCKVIIARD